MIMIRNGNLRHIQSMLTRKKEMDTLYYDIIGYADTDKSTGVEMKIPGKKDTLENAYNKVIDAIETTEKDLASIKQAAVADYALF